MAWDKDYFCTDEVLMGLIRYSAERKIVFDNFLLPIINFLHNKDMYTRFTYSLQLQTGIQLFLFFYHTC